jgi:hypothetical protein
LTVGVRYGDNVYRFDTDSSAVLFINCVKRQLGRYTGRAATISLWIEVYKVFHEILSVVDSLTVRQVFYQLVSRSAIPKTEEGYKKVVRNIRDMRRGNWLPYSWIADNTRWARRPNTFKDVSQFLDEQSRIYRKAIWEDQKKNIEIWCEKDALAGVISDVTYPWDVPLYVTRGYPSDTLAYNAVNHYRDSEKPVKIYYFGDWDPSGKDISRNLEEKLRGFAREMRVDLFFERVAVLDWQIREWGLPTRPTKKSDSRSKNFVGESVELDAIPPAHLQELVKKVIRENIDPAVYDRTVKIEQVERANLEQITGIFKKWDLGSLSGETFVQNLAAIVDDMGHDCEKEVAP